MSLKTSIFNFFRQIFFFAPFEKLLVGLTKNGQPDSFFAKFVPNHYQYRSRTMRKATRRGIDYALDLGDIVDWHIYYGFSDEVKDKLFSFIKPGDTVLDIGANMGETGLNFAKRVGAEGRVIGFEPDKDNFRRLTENVHLNQFENFHLVNKGLGDVPGGFLIKMNETEPGNAGSKRIIGTSKSDSAEDMKVEIIRLDDFIGEAQIDKIDFIKMDVEGYEMNVLLGGKKVISKFKPKMFLELHDHKLIEQGYSGNQLLELLNDMGYKDITNAETGAKVSLGSVSNGEHFDIYCQ